MDIGWAQRILRKPDRISRFLIDRRPGGARLPLQQVAGDSLRLVEAGAETDLQRLTASFHLNLTAFGLLSFLVGLFIVHSAIGLAFEQRLPMFRTLRACGVSRARAHRRSADRTGAARLARGCRSVSAAAI